MLPKRRKAMLTRGWERATRWRDATRRFRAAVAEGAALHGRLLRKSQAVSITRWLTEANYRRAMRPKLLVARELRERIAK